MGGGGQDRRWGWTDWAQKGGGIGSTGVHCILNPFLDPILLYRSMWTCASYLDLPPTLKLWIVPLTWKKLPPTSSSLKDATVSHFEAAA